MSKLKTLLFIGIFWFGAQSLVAVAEDQAEVVEEPTAAVDSIFGLDRINHVALGPNDKRLVITLSDRVLIYELFPLRLVQDVPLRVRGYASALSDKGNLYVLTDDWSNTIGGSFQIYEDVLNLEDFDDPFVPGEVPIVIDATPFTDLYLTDAGEIFFSGATRKSVLQFHEEELTTYLSEVRNFITNGGENPTFLKPQEVFLQCDTSSKFSAFTAEQGTIYLSSAIGSKILELGPVNYGERDNKLSDCFSPVPQALTRSIKTLSDVRGTPLEHTLVDASSFMRMDEYILDTALLSFDATRADLTFIPMEFFGGFPTFVRTESVSLNLSDRMGREIGDNKIGLLASDKDGQVILLGVQGSRRVHRVHWNGTDFDYVGRFDVPHPIGHLAAGPDGIHFVVSLMSDDLEGTEQVLILRDPVLIPEFDVLPSQRFSVQMLQQQWNVAAGDTLNEDGILGPATGGIVEKLTTDGMLATVDGYGSPDLSQTMLSLFPLAFDSNP